MKHFAKHSLRSVLLCVFSFLLLTFSGNISGQTIISGWDFQTSPGTAVLASPNTPTLFNANVGSGTLYLNGTNSASTWLPSTELNAFGGTGLNGGGSTGLSSIITSPACLAIVGGAASPTANGKSMVFKVNMSAYQNLIISYATQKTSTGFNSQVWEYSTNGTTWFPIGTISTIPAAFAVQTLTAISGLNGISNALVRLTVTGATNATGNNRLDNIQFNATLIPVPTLTASPSSITNLNYTTGNGASTASSYTLSGSNLTPTAGDITVTAPANFEISKTGVITEFFDNLTVPYTISALNTTIYGRLKAGLAENTYSDTIRHSGGGVSIATLPKVRVSGSVTNVPPPVITTTGTSTAFSTFVGNPSVSQSYTVSGVNLLNDITITAPAGFQIKTGIGAYTSSFTLTPSSGSVPTTTIDVQMPATATGSFSGNITHASMNVSPTVDVAVSGTVVAACATPTAISTVRAGIPEQNAYTGTVSITIAGRVSARYGNNKFYLQDATGGLAVFSSYNGGVAQSNGIVVGDSVVVTGVTARFNGEAELVPPTSTSTAPFTCINRIAGSGASTTPALLVFDSNNPPTGVNLATFLDANEGRRVKIISVNFITMGNFAASTNYPISACNGQGDSEIRIDVAASQTLTGTTIPTVTQDITGVIGHYITSTGAVNILQIFPVSPTDLSNSVITCVPVVITSAASCGVLSATSYPADSTLDVTAWNVEWLGNTTATPSPLGPTNDAQQMTNVLAVLNATKADVFCIEEVCDHNQFIARVGTDLPGYGVSCQTAYYSHFFDTPEVSGNATTYSQKVCFVYKTAIVTPVTSEIKSLLSDVYTYNPPTGPNNWASGRLPYLFVANVTLGGITKKIHFVGLHAKSGSALADYNRRKQDVIDLKAKLDSNIVYANANIIMLGDYNDDLDTSIAASKPSSYKNFVTDNVRYNQISKALSDCKVSSTAKYPDIIDHFMTSNEIGVISGGTPAVIPSVSDIYYLDKTINVSRPINYVTSYTTSTSDHYPVNARFKFGIPATIKSVASGNWSLPATWDCNCVPQSINNVIVDTPHTVTVDVASLAKNVDVKGILNYVSALMLSLGL